MLSVMKRFLLGVLLFSALTLAGQTQGTAAAGQPEKSVATQVSAISPSSPQVNGGWLQPGEDPQNRLLTPFLKHLGGDQKQFWTAPAKLQVKDLKWIAPSAGLLSAFIASDSWWAKQVPLSHISTSKTISDYGAYSMIGLGGASVYSRARYPRRSFGRNGTTQ